MIAAELCEASRLVDERLERIQRIGELMPLVLARYEVHGSEAAAAGKRPGDVVCRTLGNFAIAPVGPQSMNPYTWENTHCR